MTRGTDPVGNLVYKGTLAELSLIDAWQTGSLSYLNPRVREYVLRHTSFEATFTLWCLTPWGEA